MKKIGILLLVAAALVCAAEVADSSQVAAVAEKGNIYQNIIGWYNEHLNYATVALLMVLESSFIPFPSELVVPPAAYRAFQPDSGLNIVLILIAATVGALVGAFINYYLAKFLGRPIICKFADSKLGHMCLLDSTKVDKAEKFFREHGAISTLVGRFIPVIRQLISIPAGIAGMKLVPFTVFTAIGALVWNIILAVLGYVAHGQQDIIQKYNSELSMGVVGLVGLFVIYILAQAFRKKKK